MNCHLIDRNTRNTHNTTQQPIECYSYYNFLRNTFHFTKLKTLKLHLTYEEILFKNNKSNWSCGRTRFTICY